jgi:hypothetical protein
MHIARLAADCPPARLLVWWLILCTAVVAGCTSQQYSVGTDARFCPSGRAAITPDGGWIPGNEPGLVKGFSFSGCAGLPWKSRALCHLPKNLISADVMNPSAKRHNSWSDVIESADLQARLAERPVRLSFAHGGDFAVIESRTWNDLWLFKLPHNVSGSSAVDRLHSSYLAAVCMPGKGNYDYECHRSTVASGYVIDYVFGSATRAPSHTKMLSLDRALIKEIDAWKCK